MTFPHDLRRVIGALDNRRVGDPSGISEVLEDKNVKQPDQILFDSIEVDMIERLLSMVDERESKILRMRYGLVDGDPMTLKEIGERVNLSRERVRQIENEALKKQLGEREAEFGTLESEFEQLKVVADRFQSGAC